MELWGIARAECCGYPSLCPRRRGVPERTLREDHHVTMIGRAPRRVQPCDPRSDDEEAGTDARAQKMLRLK